MIAFVYGLDYINSWEKENGNRYNVIATDCNNFGSWFTWTDAKPNRLLWAPTKWNKFRSWHQLATTFQCFHWRVSYQFKIVHFQRRWHVSLNTCNSNSNNPSSNLPTWCLTEKLPFCMVKVAQTFLAGRIDFQLFFGGNRLNKTKTHPFFEQSFQTTYITQMNELRKLKNGGLLIKHPNSTFFYWSC